MKNNVASPEGSTEGSRRANTPVIPLDENMLRLQVSLDELPGLSSIICEAIRKAIQLSLESGDGTMLNDILLVISLGPDTKLALDVQDGINSSVGRGIKSDVVLAA